MAVTMIFVRAKASKKPTSPKKIILPPIFMSTGAVMFFIPEFRLNATEVIEALLLGAIFSLLLIKTTKFEREGKDIYLIPSKAFIFVLIGLFLLRLIIKIIVGAHISFGETSGMFFFTSLWDDYQLANCYVDQVLSIEKGVKKWL